ncbi:MULTISPECIES: hypothetical protein [Microcystis]|nr:MULTISPECIES: hypothetical protein [Microcystis]
MLSYLISSQSDRINGYPLRESAPQEKTPSHSPDSTAILTAIEL